MEESLAPVVGGVVDDKLIESEEPLDAIANIASTCNAIASLCVGHLKILVEGGFDVNLANSMTANLHAHLLGLHPMWEVDDDDDSWMDDIISGDDDDSDDE